MISFFKSLRIAFNGIWLAFKSEPNFRIQIFIGALVVFLMFFFQVTSLEKAVLSIVILLVLSLEMVNTQIEKSLDLIQPALDPKVKLIKDISAGAVLISVMGALIAGIIVFYPYFNPY
jgi:diacylglycerol kinase